MPKGHSKPPPGSQASSAGMAEQPAQAVRDSLTSDQKDHWLRQLINTDSIWSRPTRYLLPLRRQEAGEVQMILVGLLRVNGDEVTEGFTSPS